MAPESPVCSFVGGDIEVCVCVYTLLYGSIACMPCFWLIHVFLLLHGVGFTDAGIGKRVIHPRGCVPFRHQSSQDSDKDRRWGTCRCSRQVECCSEGTFLFNGLQYLVSGTLRITEEIQR